MLNEFELIQVVEDLRKKGIKNYNIQSGKNCIWVTYSLVNSYYIFKNSRLIDIQFD